MFKSLLQNMVLYGVSLFLLPFVVTGVKIVGGTQTYILGGIALTFMFMILKPVFNVLTFPFNVITLGLFSTITNAIILYLLTIFIPNITVMAFTTDKTAFAGFSIPSIQFNTIFAFIAAAVILSVISGAIRWLIK